MKNTAIYIDMDGVINDFESDKNARKNMWEKGYFENIPPIEETCKTMKILNKYFDVIILSKIIERSGVIEEKQNWLSKNLCEKSFSEVIYVPYADSKVHYINFNKYKNIILIDDNERNLDECSGFGVHCIKFRGGKSNYKVLNNLSDFDKEWFCVH